MILVPTCLVGTGCSSLFLPDGGEFTADNSRLVDMRPSKLDSLVAEARDQASESSDELPGTNNASDVELGEADVLSELAKDVTEDEVWQVNHKAAPVLQPLQVEVSAEEIAGGAGEGEPIIILKAKSTDPANVHEMIEPTANPATPPVPVSTAADPGKRPSSSMTPNPLAPIHWGSDVSPAYSGFEPARLVCGAGCDCEGCRAADTTSDTPDTGEDAPVDTGGDAMAIAADSESVDPLPGSDASPLETEVISEVAGEAEEAVPADSEMSASAAPAEADANQFDPASHVAEAGSETASPEPAGEEPLPVAPAGTGELVAVEPISATSESSALPWDLQLKATITAFENQIIDLNLSDYRRPKLQQSLAILQALDDRLSSGRIALEQPKHRQYWQYQMTAVLNMLQAAKTNEDGGRENVSVAIAQLKSAVVELQQLSELSIARVEFCSEVSGYGQFVTMDRSQFRPDTKTLIYCEIENFHPVQENVADREMFATRLECQFEIRGSDGKVVQSVDFPIVEDVAMNRRRDFYMHLPLTLDQLPAGDYQVHLKVKDLGSEKVAHHQLPDLITIKP